MQRISGIYKIQSKIKPNKIYIGSAVNIRERWNDHKCRLRIGKHINPKLQNHYNKYGLDDLSFSIITGCHKDDLVALEQFYIDAFDPWFNICKVAGSCLGVRCSDEKKEILRMRNMGHETSIETRRKISETKRRAGLKLSDDQKKYISDRNNGMTVSQERRDRIRKKLMGHGASEETRKKMSEKAKAWWAAHKQKNCEVDNVVSL